MVAHAGGGKEASRIVHRWTNIDENTQRGRGVIYTIHVSDSESDTGMLKLPNLEPDQEKAKPATRANQERTLTNNVI